jgi:hypothetical protein
MAVRSRFWIIRMGNQDSVGHIRLDDVSAKQLTGSSIEEMETTMKFIVEVRFSDEIVMQADQLEPADRKAYLEDKIEDALEGGYYEHVAASLQVEVKGPGNTFEERSYFEMVWQALEKANPNDSSTEEWVPEAIRDLAVYLKANDHSNQDVRNIDNLYEMYDMLKWTRANNA